MRIIGCTLIGLALAGLALFYAETGSFRQPYRYISGVTLALPWRLAVPADRVSADDAAMLKTRLIADPPLLGIILRKDNDHEAGTTAPALLHAFEQELATRGITHYQLEVAGWLVTRGMTLSHAAGRPARRCLVSVDAPTVPPFDYQPRQAPLVLGSCYRLPILSDDEEAAVP